MDEFSSRSHQRATAARKAGTFAERSCRWSMAGQGLCRRRRRARGFERRAGQAAPFFDKKYGNVTAGNSSQITDGAAWLLLASGGGR
jgi:acetyl-CoA C-acetyltransferase